MEFRLLGPVELYDDVRGCRVELNGPKQRTLLAALLVRSGVVVPVEQLIEELWGGCPPAKAVNAVQAHVARLRRLFQQHEPDRTGPERLVTRAYGYSLLVEEHETDVGRFKSAGMRAKAIITDDPAGAVALLRGALGLWRGDALEGDVSGSICATAANLLDEERLNALETLYDASLRADQHVEVVSELRDLSAAYPLRERFYDQLMVALYRCGRQTEALGVYETARRRLAAELGLEPTPALAQRMLEILSHSDPPNDTGTARLRLASESDTLAARPPALDSGSRASAAGSSESGEVNKEIARLRHVVDRLRHEYSVLASMVHKLTSEARPSSGRSHATDAHRVRRVL